jgi:DNA polymerase III alpha subunit (gram-positive type)
LIGEPKYILIDAETGGLDCNKHSLLTLFALLLDSKANIIDKIDLKIKPKDHVYCVCAEALNVNNINLLEHDKIAMAYKMAQQKFHDFLSNHKVPNTSKKIMPIGQNVNFDIGFMKMFYKNWNKVISHRTVDLISVTEFLKLTGTINMSSDEENSLENVAKHFNMCYSDAHEAEFDVMLTYKLLKLYIGFIQKQEIKYNE